jgi:hypothetical protein
MASSLINYTAVFAIKNGFDFRNEELPVDVVDILDLVLDTSYFMKIYTLKLSELLSCGWEDCLAFTFKSVDKLELFWFIINNFEYHTYDDGKIEKHQHNYTFEECEKLASNSYFTTYTEVNSDLFYNARQIITENRKKNELLKAVDGSHLSKILEDVVDEEFKSIMIENKLRCEYNSLIYEYFYNNKGSVYETPLISLSDFISILDYSEDNRHILMNIASKYEDEKICYLCLLFLRFIPSIASEESKKEYDQFITNEYDVINNHCEDNKRVEESRILTTTDERVNIFLKLSNIHVLQFSSFVDPRSVLVKPTFNQNGKNNYDSSLINQFPFFAKRI